VLAAQVADYQVYQEGSGGKGTDQDPAPTVSSVDGTACANN
jgi:hypothetical protein